MASYINNTFPLTLVVQQSTVNASCLLIGTHYHMVMFSDCWHCWNDSRYLMTTEYMWNNALTEYADQATQMAVHNTSALLGM